MVEAALDAVVARAAVDRLASGASTQVVGAAATLDRRRLAIGRGVDLDSLDAVVADHGRRDEQPQHVEVADVVALAGPPVVGHAVEADGHGPAVGIRAAVAPVAQRVVARAAVQHVGCRRRAGVARQLVVAGRALEHVGSRAPDQLVAVGPAAQDVSATFGAQDVAARAAVERQPRVAVDRLELVGSRATEDLDERVALDHVIDHGAVVAVAEVGADLRREVALDDVADVDLGAAVSGERVRSRSRRSTTGRSSSPPNVTLLASPGAACRTSVSPW